MSLIRRQSSTGGPPRCRSYPVREPPGCGTRSSHCASQGPRAPASALRRDGEQPGRRGQVLALTPAGEKHLAAAAQAVRCRLAERLADWDDGDVAAFARLVDRFNESKNQP